MSHFERLNSDGRLSDEIDQSIADRDRLVNDIIQAEQALAVALRPLSKQDLVDDLGQVHAARSAALMQAAFDAGYREGQHDAEMIQNVVVAAKDFSTNVIAAIDRLGEALGRIKEE